MSAFSNWFRSKGDPPPQGPGPDQLDQQVAELLASAKDQPLGFQGTALNRAGDLCLKAGDREKALAYFGRAIDLFLEDEQPEPARGVAKKIIRVHPEAVRTLCTLTWLDLAARHVAAACLHLGEYTEAAKRSRRGNLARDPIMEMARTTTEEEFLKAAAMALDELGYKEQASQVREWKRKGGAPGASSDSQDLALRCFKGAVGSNIQRRAEGALA